MSRGLPHTSHTLAVRTPSNTTGANMLHAGSYVGWRCQAAMCHATMRERLKGTYVRSCRDVRGAVRSPVRRAARHNFQCGYSRAHSIPGKAVRAHRVASKWDGDGCAPTRRLGSDQSAVSPPRLSSTPSADFPLLQCVKEIRKQRASANGRTQATVHGTRHEGPSNSELSAYSRLTPPSPSQRTEHECRRG